MIEYSQFLKDHQAACQTLNDELNKIFEIAKKNFRQLTNFDAGIPPTIGENYMADKNSRKIMRSLIQLKVYEPTPNNNFNSESSGLLQLVSQSTVILDLCDSLFTRLEEFIDEYVKHVLNLARNLDSSYNIRSLMLHWKRISYTYEESSLILMELYEYVRENLPQVRRSVETFQDMKTKLLINSFKYHMGSKFVELIKEFLDNERSKGEPNETTSESFLHTIFHYNIVIDEDRNQYFPAFYFEYLANYVENEVVIPINANYTENLKKQLELNAKITLAISPTMIEKSNDIFLQHTILKPGIVSQLIEFDKDNVQFYQCRGSDRILPLPKESFLLLELAFKSRGRTFELERIFRKSSRQILRKAYPDPERLFAEACKLISLVTSCPEFEVISREEVIKILGGSLNIMELYVRFCESSIRKTHHDRTMMEHYVRSRSIFLAPTLLKMGSEVLNLYSRSLFRRTIMKGAKSVLRSLRDPSSLEFRLMNFYRHLYGTTSEFRNLESTTEIILKASDLESSFERDSGDEYKFIQPLLFEKKMVPTIFQQGTSEDIKLPRELVDSWETFMRYFNLTDKNADLKKVHPVYHLQHCEVSTPYKLKGGRRLSLELTLYQTCLLSLFNYQEELDYDEITKKLRMTKSTLDVVLKSFLDVGLLVLGENSKYTLNGNYSPDKRKIKNNKLRIPLSKTLSSNRSVSTANMVISSQHNEGHSSQWKQELLKACIVRSVKGENVGLDLLGLFHRVESQLRGISIGEFKDALHQILEDEFVRYRNGRYIY